MTGMTVSHNAVYLALCLITEVLQAPGIKTYHHTNGTDTVRAKQIEFVTGTA